MPQQNRNGGHPADIGATARGAQPLSASARERLCAADGLSMVEQPVKPNSN